MKVELLREDVDKAIVSYIKELGFNLDEKDVSTSITRQGNCTVTISDAKQQLEMEFVDESAKEEKPF